MSPVRTMRKAQLYPILTVEEIERMKRFGQERRFQAGEVLGSVGKVGLGLGVVLSGKVDVTRPGERGQRELHITHEPGGFMGEIAQLSGRPALVDVHAQSDVQILVIASDQLRALVIADADLGERIMRALILRRVELLESGLGGPIVIGRATSGRVLQLQGFLSRNNHPYVWLDPDIDSDARALIERFDVCDKELPIVLCADGRILHNPSDDLVARSIGLVKAIDSSVVYDVVIVGAGPAGLAASVYAASEGLSVLTLDCRAFGGQAGASARIENFLGFPTGISGVELMSRAFNQAQKFGVELEIPDEVMRLECPDGKRTNHLLTLLNGERVQARAVVIATGARYRQLGVPGIEPFEGSSVHYWASALEARLVSGQCVALIGGGNSAGQAAVFLARHCARIVLLVRRPLRATMSSYLVERIIALPNIEVIENAEVTEVEGTDATIEAIFWRSIKSQETTRLAVRHAFLFIGADPNTGWLAKSGVTLDSRGFIVAEPAPTEGRLPLETTRSGVFAIGDVRSGSVKRVAAAAGDGALVVAALHSYLATRSDFANPEAGKHAATHD